MCVVVTSGFCGNRMLLLLPSDLFFSPISLTGLKVLRVREYIDPLVLNITSVEKFVFLNYNHIIKISLRHYDL